MKLTKKNHSNPCFWTAYWNIDYLKNALLGRPVELQARDQIVYSLNVRADKIIEDKVSNIHVETDIGITEITPDAMKNFCRKYFPLEYERFVEDMKGHPETLIMPIEQILDAIENTLAYKMLLRVISKEAIDNREEIAHLATFVIFQYSRSHAILRSALERIKAVKIAPFEYFWLFKKVMGSPDSLFPIVDPLATSQWIIYRTKGHTFPLPDTPVLIKPRNIMIALSPRMLAEIRLDVHDPEGSWTIKSEIPDDILNEYQRRAIASTYKELIFANREVLKDWKGTPEFRRQVELVCNVRPYTELLEHTLQRPVFPDIATLRRFYKHN